MKTRIITLLTAVAFMLAACSGNTQSPSATPTPTPNPKPLEGTSIILSTTTSTQDSGLLDYLLPMFTDETGVEVRTVAVGTGKAIEMGRNGEADVLLVHSRADEDKLVEEGFGIERFDVMYNDFILVGPADDPLKLKDLSGDIAKALALIKNDNAVFVSRGDDSGTHKKELTIWKSAEITPEWENYLSVGMGMGDTLKVADEKLGYTIADRATYLAMKDNLTLEILVEGDDSMLNPYGIICVNPDKFEKINNEGAEAFQTWLLSAPVQKLIGEFGVDKYGQPLFYPDAK